MDEVLVEALAQTPEGQAFTGLPRTAASEEIRAAWESFTQVLAADYLPRLQAAAGDDLYLDERPALQRRGTGIPGRGAGRAGHQDGAHA